MTDLETFAPLVRAYLAQNHEPGKELVFKDFASGPTGWVMSAAFYASESFHWLKSMTSQGYRYVRVGIEVLPGRQFKITFIQHWAKGMVVGEAELYSEVFDVH